MFVGQPQMQFTPQSFAPPMTGGVPPGTVMGAGPIMSSMTLPNGGYGGLQQPGMLPASQGQNMYMQQGQQQWNMSQVTSNRFPVGGLQGGFGGLGGFSRNHLTSRVFRNF